MGLFHRKKFVLVWTFLSYFDNHLSFLNHLEMSTKTSTIWIMVTTFHIIVELQVYIRNGQSFLESELPVLVAGKTTKHIAVGIMQLAYV